MVARRAAFPRVVLLVASVALGPHVAAALQAPKPVAGAAPLLDAPVYSLATLNDDGTTNANIVTYASPVGIRPQRLWAVSLFRGTRTFANFAARRGGVLQLLCDEHAAATHALGGVSAADAGAPDKAAACAALGLAWEPSADGAERVLPRCAAYVRLEATGDPADAGDHAVFLCRVASAASDAGAAHLTSGALRARGLVDAKGRAVAPAARAAPFGAAAPAAAAPAARAAPAAPFARRAAAALVAAAAAAAPFGAAVPAAAAPAAPLAQGECREESLGPLYTKRTCLKNGLVDGRLRGCLASENCVSTSAIKSPAQFGAPWTFSPATTDAAAAFDSLVAALRAAPGLRVVAVDADRRYVRAEAPTTIAGGQGVRDVDDVEFVVDDKEQFVFYRSASREAVFLVPGTNIYSVPLGDGGSNAGRLDALRKTLGWESTAARGEDVEDDFRQYQALQPQAGFPDLASKIPTFGLMN